MIPSAGLFSKRLPAGPDLLALRRLRPERYPFLLQSARHVNALGRHDLLLAFPGESLILDSRGRLEGPGAGGSAHEGFLPALDAWWREAAGPAVRDPDLPFQGGWFLYLGYELAAEIEPSLKLPGPVDGLPVAMASYCPAAVIRDHQAGETILVADSRARLEAMEADLEQAAGACATCRPGAMMNVREDPPAAYLRAVDRIREYIREGDVFQVNLSRAWEADLPRSVSRDELYQALSRANPAPFAGLADLPGGYSIVSSSPERLVRVGNGRIETRPIAGTRPRGNNVDDDQAFSEELLLHPKERAEHIMLIDLERNDLGRVCQPGSVEVNELMALETYAHVHHIVSNVRGILRDGATPGEVIRAVFPGGTITGCPKVRCMEIIAELEGVPRGPYTGSMGYLDHAGGMDLNILIRTMLYRPGHVTWRAGAGIVADSVPRRELDETRAKALGLLRALEGRDE